MNAHKRTFREMVLLHLLVICGISLLFFWIIPIFHYLTVILVAGVLFYLYKKERKKAFGSNPYRTKR